MYIIKLDHKTQYSSRFYSSITENLTDLRLKNKQTQIILKKNSTLSQRFHQPEQDEHYSQRKYSDSFRNLMNKVIHRINRRNNFIKNNQNKDMSNFSPVQFLKEEVPQITFSLDYPKKKNKILYQKNKLKIKGIGRAENDSNLLQKPNKQNPFIKTSISFVKNKEFKKSIQCRRTKSFSSDIINSDNSVQNGKQKSFMLNNTRYCPAQFKRTMLEESFKVGSFIPKITAKQNYQQMQQLLKANIESKRSKIDIGKKLFHKKMVQRQKKSIKLSNQIHKKQTYQIKNTLKSREKFEPWIIHEDYIEDGFKISTKQYQ